MARRPTGDAVTAAAWQSASLLLDYPGSRDRSIIGSVLPHLPSEFAGPLGEVFDRMNALPTGELQEDYVATFDNHRRHSLFLSYFTHGDTRKRGNALLRFKEAYRAAGVDLAEAELPDHLCVVLEFAATVDLVAGRQLLLDHRVGLELLRISLRDAGSLWAPLLEVVCRGLPALPGDEWDVVRRLAEQGPPAEEVGLTPYGTPGFDPGPASPSGPVDLPMPAVPSAGGI